MSTTPTARKLSRRSLMKAAGVTAAGAATAPFLGPIGVAHAAWPADKPVRIVVANSPGGPSDIIARVIAPELQSALGGTFIVENKPGGGGNIGMNQVIRAEPDGYSMHLATSIFAINPALYDPPPYDPFTDMIPVVELAVAPSVIVVQADHPAKTLRELIEMMRKDQDKYNIAVPPISTTLAMAAELLKQRENLPKVAILPHSGGGQAIQALLSGTVQLCVSSLPPAIPHIDAGKMRALAIQSPKRWPTLPNVPTTEEAGLKDFIFETYTSIMGTPKTPADIVKRVETAALAALAKPDVKDRLIKLGFFVEPRTGAGHLERLKKEVPMFKAIAKAAGIKAKQ